MARDGNIASMTSLLADGADVDERAAEGCYAIHWAADRGQSTVHTCASVRSVEGIEHAWCVAHLLCSMQAHHAKKYSKCLSWPLWLSARSKH